MSRAWGPFDHGVSAYFLSANRNTRGIAVDFRKPEGLALIRELARNADILVENFKPAPRASGRASVFAARFFVGRIRLAAWRCVIGKKGGRGA
jgi:hypothetical protein